jgi:arylsulfatase A-like enzyme
MTDDEVKRAGYQNYLKEYLRCVRGVDDNIKRLLDHLKTEDELDNTLIIYTSDQGMMLGEHDYIDKRWMYEESLRMPFIVRYPKTIKAGTHCDALINNTDFAPTLLDYAGIPAPQSMQGRSFRAIMETGKEPANWRKATYYRYWMHMKHHYNPAHFGIRTKEWKLIFFYGSGESEKRGNGRTPPGWELYNMKNDPLEMNNLYGNPKYTKLTEQLKDQLKAVRTEVKDSDVDNPFIGEIIAKHWEGGESEAIQISNRIVNNPIGNENKNKQGQSQ